MNNSLSEKFFDYMTEFQKTLNLNTDKLRINIGATITDKLTDVEYLNKTVGLASKLFIDMFDDNDNIMIYIETRDADLWQDYDKTIQEDIKIFYRQLIKGEDIKECIQTFSTYLDENGQERYTAYSHVDSFTETQSMDLMTNYILEGKVKDFETLGFIVGKCSLMQGFETEEEPAFVIGDDITIVNTTKNVIYTLHNDIYLDVISTDKDIIAKLKEEHSEIIIEF